MLHVVPALLLLIIQGPSAMDRLPCHGRLPTALEALNARMEPLPGGATKISSRQAAIASLLALGAKDPRWSAAIARFLDGTGYSPVSQAPDELLIEETGSVRLPRAGEPSVPSPRFVFATSTRFRDGPLSR
jgi:hypothetical protein